MTEIEFLGNYTRVSGFQPSEEELSELCMRKGCLYQFTGDYLIVPRGYTTTVYRWILSRGGGELRYYAPYIEPQLPESITSELRDYQIEVLTDALRYLRVQGAATITMPTGGGKTYSIAGLIKYMLESGYVKKVYFFAHTNDLVLQAADWFQKWGLDVGVVGGGRFEPNHQVVASTLQTMYRSLRDLASSGKIKPPEGIKVSEYSTPIGTPSRTALEPLIEIVSSDEEEEEGEYEILSESQKLDYATEYLNLGKDALVLIDECLPYDALVVTDRGLLPIGKIVEERLPVRVLTHKGRFMKVAKYFKIPLVKRLVRIRHEEGELVATEDHLILTQRGWVPAIDIRSGDVVYFYAGKDLRLQDMRKDVPILASTGRSYSNGAQTRPSSIETQKMAGFEQEESSSADKNDYKREGREEVTEPAEVDRGTEGNSAGFSAWGWAPGYSAAKGEECQANNSACFIPVRVLDVEVLKAGKHSKDSAKTSTYEEVWGIWRHLSIPNHLSPGVNRNLHGILYKQEENSNHRVPEHDKDPDSTSHLVLGRWLNTAISGKELLHNQTLHGGLYTGGEQTVEGLAGEGVGRSVFYTPREEEISRPIYAEHEGSGEFYRVDKINSGGGVSSQEEFVYDLEVEEDHSFVANGVVVHNCHHEPAHSIEYVITANPHSLRVGMSASPWRGLDGLTKHIYATLGNIVDRRVDSSELIEKGYLVPVLIVMYFRRPNMIKFLERFPDVRLDAGGKKLYDKLKEYLYLYDEDRLRNAIEVASIVPKPGVFILNEIAPTLKTRQLLSGAGFKVEAMIGTMSGEKRKQVLDDIRNGKLDFIVTTKLFNEGIDVPALRSVIIMDGALSPVLILQRVGRVARPFPGKSFGVVVDFVDDTSYFRFHAVLRWMLYRSERYWAVARTGSLGGIQKAIKQFEELNLDRERMARLFREISRRRNWKGILNILMNL